MNGNFDTFEYTTTQGDRLVWNVTYAKALVAAGQTIARDVEMAREQMQEVVSRNFVEPAHLDTVSDDVPGIAAPLIWNGAILYVLIDGTHRCARALRDGRTFRAHLLTDAANRACLVEAPPELVP